MVPLGGFVAPGGADSHALLGFLNRTPYFHETGTLDIYIDLKKELDGKADGYCWEGGDNRQHFIEIKKTLEGDDFITCIMHEMVHVKQQARGEMQPMLAAMEAEAYEKQEILLERWKYDK